MFTTFLTVLFFFHYFLHAFGIRAEPIKKQLLKNAAVQETSKDKFSELVGIWPTNHKGAWSIFEVKIKKIPSKVLWPKQVLFLPEKPLQ